MADEIIRIDKYEPTLIKGKTVIYAIKNKTKYLVPTEFADMCDEHHLAITRVHTEMPELFDIVEKDFYIPLLTD